jgi:FAD/FMN-containing dehydrogenase
MSSSNGQAMLARGVLADHGAVELDGHGEVEEAVVCRYGSSSSAVVQPGITGDILDPLLAGHGLFFPLGHCSAVGISGFLMGGGYGWNSRLHGPDCFSTEAVEVVTAEGELVWFDDTRT